VKPKRFVSRAAIIRQVKGERGQSSEKLGGHLKTDDEKKRYLKREEGENLGKLKPKKGGKKNLLIANALQDV